MYYSSGSWNLYSEFINLASINFKGPLFCGPGTKFPSASLSETLDAVDANL
jgi:hypothetical protein